MRWPEISFSAVERDTGRIEVAIVVEEGDGDGKEKIWARKMLRLLA